jgi:hypothetical protein
MSADLNYVYVPTERQTHFHTLSDDYMVLGGSRGSGKSLCVLIEALGLAYNAHLPTSKQWKCLILRRTVPQLEELLSRAVDLYPKIVPSIKYNSQKNTFTYSNGGFIKFASCERDVDIEKYRGHEYNMIIIDELSHFDNDYVWNWIKSSNRNSNGYPNRMIGTSNPCMWVKKMCKIDDYGHDSFQVTEYFDEMSKTTIKKTLRFVQMNIDSNPHLSLDYRAGLAQDIHNKDQFLHGMWTAPKIPGMVYELELDKMMKEHRVCNVPHDPAADTYTVWDLGYADNMVVLFIQYVGKEIHIINKIESNQLGLPDYLGPVLKIGKDLGYRYAKHLVPHDAKQHELQTGLTREQMMKKSLGDVEVLPRLGIEEGISKTKEIFPNLWIHKDLDIVDKLRTYKRRWNPTTQLFGEPIHDESSHGADTVRMISYYKPRAKVENVAFRNSRSRY